MKAIKKLWGYIKRKRGCRKVVVKIILSCDENDDVNANVSVEANGPMPERLVKSINTYVKITKADSGRSTDSVINSEIKMNKLQEYKTEI